MSCTQTPGKSGTLASQFQIIQLTNLKQCSFYYAKKLCIVCNGVENGFSFVTMDSTQSCTSMNDEDYSKRARDHGLNHNKILAGDSICLIPISWPISHGGLNAVCHALFPRICQLWRICVEKCRGLIEREYYSNVTVSLRVQFSSFRNEMTGVEYRCQGQPPSFKLLHVYHDIMPKYITP